ncbi:autophagy protein 6 [Kluyveromyces marxianus]|nr:autophagy protein 6 [Kluyveromyces marxianus]KAG0685192.1 autophagy protein 6 [Kluyveromyces marxianus]
MGDLTLRCMNCRSLLDIDSSLVDLSMAQRDLLLNSETNTDSSDNNKHNGENDRNVIPQEKLKIINQVKSPSQLRIGQAKNVTAESYVFLTDTEFSLTKFKNNSDEFVDDEDYDERNKTLSSRISALSNIVNILSCKSNIDYPVCQGCCDTLLEKLKEEYNQELKKRDTYHEFMKRIQEQNNSVEIYSDGNKGPKELKNLKREKEELLRQLQELEGENDLLQNDIQTLQSQLKEKQEQQLEQLREKNVQQMEHLSFIKDIQSLKNQRVVTLNHIDSLRKLNIYNETFRISHKGPFGTINELRLGSVPKIQVPWTEINAALGQVVLLLSLIVEKTSLPLPDYNLKPMGSTSVIEKRDLQTDQWFVLKAYGGSEFSLSSLFHKENPIDKALLAILEIIKKLSENVSSNTSESASIELPYDISDDKINGLSILLKSSSPSLEWTTACKFLLTNIKWLLAFSTSRINKAKP